MVLVEKNPPANAGDSRDMGLTPGSGRSPGEGHGHPLQSSSLENLMDRRAWWATVHGVAKRWTQLKWLSTQSWSIHTFLKYSCCQYIVCDFPPSVIFVFYAFSFSFWDLFVHLNQYSDFYLFISFPTHFAWIFILLALKICSFPHVCNPYFHILIPYF